MTLIEYRFSSSFPNPPRAIPYNCSVTRLAAIESWLAFIASADEFPIEMHAWTSARRVTPWMF
jgi:hypothetical protein